MSAVDIDYGMERGLGLGLVLERLNTGWSFGIVFLCFWFEVIW